MVGVARSTHAPFRERHAAPFANYEEKAILWRQISPLGPQKRAASLLLHMTDVAREVRMTVGKDVIGNARGVAHTLRILRERSAPDAMDSIFQDMAKFTYFKRTGQNMDTYLMEFDMLRQKAEARMLMGSGSPDEFAPVLFVQNAALTKNEKTLALASSGNTLAFESVSAQMRRLFGPCDYASRQDVLAAADMDTVPEDEDFEARMAYRKAKRVKKDVQNNGGPGSSGEQNSSRGGRAKNGFNRPLGNEIAATRETANTMMLRSARRKRTGMRALPPFLGEARRLPANPTHPLPWNHPLVWGVQ